MPAGRISACLFAVADVYDVLVSKMFYKSEVFHEETVGINRQGRGSHFDPDVTVAFLVKCS